MKRWYVLCLTLAVALAACESEPPPPPAPEPPPPPTAEEVRTAIIRSIEPFEELFVSEREPFREPRHTRTIQALRGALNQHRGGENGPQGIRLAQRHVETRLAQAQEAEYWAAVVAMCDVLDILAPDNTRTRRAREEAMLQLNRPRVTLRGFFHYEGMRIAQMSIRIPATREVFESVRAEEGEEFLEEPYTLRLVNIIGDDLGVNLEYLATGDTFQVYLERARGLW